MQTAANPSNTSSQAVLSPLFEKKKNSRNIMSSEIAEKEREFENEHEQANNINRAKTKMPIQNRDTTKIPSTINDEED